MHVNFDISFHTLNFMMTDAQACHDFNVLSCHHVFSMHVHNCFVVHLDNHRCSTACNYFLVTWVCFCAMLILCLEIILYYLLDLHKLYFYLINSWDASRLLNNKEGILNLIKTLCKNVHALLKNNSVQQNLNK